MAASPSQVEINKAMRDGLMKLSRRLQKQGVRGGYRLFRLSLHNSSNVEYAEYRLLRASNGECALYPRVKLKMGVARPDGTSSVERIYEGWDAFDKIKESA